MATIGEMIVRLLADTSNFNTNMAEAATTVKASQDAMASSMQSSMAAFRNFDAIQKDSIQTAQDLAQAQAALTAARESGAFTSEEIAAKEALVAQAMKKVGQDTQEAAGVLNLFTRNSRTMYSTSALITDAMTGQFSRMRREVAALGNETGLMAQAFRFAMSPAGLLAAALAAIALDAYNATQRINELQHAALAGGGAAGMNGDQLETMAEGFKKMGFDIQSARNAMEKLAGSGRVTSADMKNATQAALEYAQLTGEKIDTLAQRFAGLGTDGARGFLKLDQSMHFLTQSQRENIAELERTGQTAQAVSVGYNALATHGAMALQQLQSEGKKTEGFWAGVGTVIQNANDSMMKGMGFGLTKQGELDKTNKLLAYYKQIGVTGQKINELLQKRSQLEQDIAEQAKKSQQGSAGIQAGIAKDEELLRGGLKKKGHGSDTAQLDAELRQQEADQHVSYQNRLQFEADFWSRKLETEKAGTAAYAAVWRNLQDVQRQIDGQTLAASERSVRAREKAERQAAEQAKREAEGVARAQREASQEIQQEIQEEARKRQAASLAELAGVRQNALAEIATRKQQAEEAYALQEITAAQLLQIELNLVQQKLAAEMRYHRGKQQLDAGDVAAQTRNATAIITAQQKADQEMSAARKKFITDSENDWRRYTQRVSGMVSSQISAMLFQHQTLRAAVANILESMATNWIASEIKQLFTHQSVEAAKTAATVSGNAARVAADTAGQGESLAVQGASAIKWITTEAAKAAAGAFNAMVSIPYIGPFLAVGASIAAGAAVLALVGRVASAEGGWERVPADGMQTVLHKDEMVLPKHVADPVRNMARGGRNGGNGGGTYHIHALDSRSFLSALKRNPRAMQMALAHAGRNGY